MNLKAEQHRLYSLMPADAHCFVRVCGDDRALWVSDLPRRTAQCETIRQKICQAGFAVREDPEARLWYIDWSASKWQEMLCDLPEELPPLPANEANHGVYALCRLWFAHPALLNENSLPHLRRVIKMAQENPLKMRRSVRALHEETAVQLRNGQAVSHTAWRVLAAWLLEHAGG